MNSRVHAEAKELGMGNVACTIGELKALLKNVPDSTQLSCTGADIGGYDVSTRSYVALIDVDGGLLFTHLEYTAYEKNPLLTNLTGDKS